MNQRAIGTIICGLLAASALCFAPGCRPRNPPAAVGAGSAICTSFYPIAYFAGRISGESGVGPVRCLCPADEDAIFWQPSPEAIQEFHKARLVIVNGAEFEKWFLTASLPRSKVIVSAAQLPEELIEFGKATTHSHGPAGKHTHKGVDGHTWVDPINAIAQAEEICRGMTKAFPEQKDLFAANLGALKADLEKLDQGFAALGPLLQGRTLLCSHPAYNYIARRYKWTISNFDLDPESALNEAQLADVAQTAKTTGATVMLWEGQPTEEAQQQLKNLGIRSVVFSPAELLDPDTNASGVDYMEIMNGNLKSLRGALDKTQ